mgnify:FL=1
MLSAKGSSNKVLLIVKTTSYNSCFMLVNREHFFNVLHVKGDLTKTCNIYIRKEPMLDVLVSRGSFCHSLDPNKDCAKFCEA